jgi:Transposase DDE domain
MDGSGVGRGCCALMMHVIYQGRALPLAWRVRQCPKGHFPEDLHIALVELVSHLIPAGTKVVLLGDGEFDGIKLQETMHEAGWWYACRTSKGNTATWDDETFDVEELGACLKPGRLIELKEVEWTREAYGPVMLLCCWAQGHAEPLYLVSNMSSAEEAIDY